MASVGEDGAEEEQDVSDVNEGGMHGELLTADEEGKGEVMRGMGDDESGGSVKERDCSGTAEGYCGMRKSGFDSSNSAGGAKSLSEIDDS